MFTCTDEGTYSLIGVVPAGAVMDQVGDHPDHPAFVHLTVCRAHFHAARKWLQSVSPEDVLGMRTEVLMANWHQITGHLEDEPVWSLTHVG